MELKVRNIEWKSEKIGGDEIEKADYLWSYNFSGQRITVLSRKTGYSGYPYNHDIETGYRDAEGNFWLASGNVDVRENPHFTIPEAIDYIKKYANTCIARPPRENHKGSQ